MPPEPAYDPGLDRAQEERARRLYDEAVVIDCLYQGPVGGWAFTGDDIASMRTTWEETRDASLLLALSQGIPVSRALAGDLPDFEKAWLSSGVTGGNRQVNLVDLDRLSRQFGWAQAQFDHFPWLDKALVAEDFRAAKAAGRAAGYISTQLTFGPPPHLEIIRDAQRLGMRMMQLTYNSASTIGTGCTASIDGGLTAFGKQVVATLNEAGVIVDTGHVGRQTTLDACIYSRAPVVASHTGASTINPHERNKSDEEIEAIASTGGVVGIYTVPFFLTADPVATLDHWLDHVDHVVALAGWEHCAIGTDYPLQMPLEILSIILAPMAAEIGFRDEHQIDPAMPLNGFEDYRCFVNFSRALVSRGYGDDAVLGILGGNFLRVFEQACG